jgi:hypothetical protein
MRKIIRRKFGRAFLNGDGDASVNLPCMHLGEKSSSPLIHTLIANSYLTRHDDLNYY